MEIDVIMSNGQLKFTHTYRIQEGKPTVKFARKVVAYHSTLKDGEYTMRIEKAKSAKTREQNAYFHVLVKLFSDETGFTPRDCKAWLKREFGAKEILNDPITKGTTYEPKSIASYSLTELSDLIDKTVVFLRHDMGYVVPDPETRS